MRHAIRDGLAGVLLLQDRVHRLQEEVVEVQVGEALGQGQRLWINQLQLVAPGQHEVGVRFGTDADPVQPLGRWLGAVGLDGDLETEGLQRGDERPVELQQRFAAGADDVGRAGLAAIGVFGPLRVDRLRERIGGSELPAALPVGADEVGVAEAAYGLLAVLLSAGPQVAAGEAAEHGRAAGLGALALQRVEHFLDGVGHTGISSSNGPWLTMTPLPRVS